MSAGKTCEVCGAVLTSGPYTVFHSTEACTAKQLAAARVALSHVSGALCDSGVIVPADELRYGEAVRQIMAERDAARAEIARLTADVSVLDSDLDDAQSKLEAAAVAQQKIVDDAQALVAIEIGKREALEAKLARAVAASRSSLSDDLLARIAESGIEASQRDVETMARELLALASLRGDK